MSFTKEELLNITQDIEEVDATTVAEEKFIDYAKYVILDRALPDVRDGLKPVHRRILYAMNVLKLKHNKPHKKSARVVGDVIGKYHPHGDKAVYDAMVRMAQDFNMRTPLVDGQGNFGSMDGDSPAAMRYTEARMSIFAEKMFEDIMYDTVPFADNYDETEKMPTVLPIRFPNLLINGSQGIAVGMSSTMLPHNPIEVLSALKYIVDSRLSGREVSVDEVAKLIPAPDFPTGGIIHGAKEMKNIIENGIGVIYVRAKHHIEELKNGKSAIVIDEIPYQVNKAELVEMINNLSLPDKKKGGFIAVEGISGIRDESNKDGIRIYIEVKKEFDPHIIFNTLCKMTNLDKSFNYNSTVIMEGKPVVRGVLEILNDFVEFRMDVILKRTKFLLSESEERNHILLGLVKALNSNNIENVISIVRKSKSREEALKELMVLLEVDELQASNILALRLQRLTSEQVGILIEEHNELNKIILEYKEIIGSEKRRYEILISETLEEMEKFKTLKDPVGRIMGERRSSYELGKFGSDMSSMVKEEDCNIFISQKGYIRRLPISEIEEQNRGTRGKRKMLLGKDDFIKSSVNVNSHDKLYLVTKRGQVHTIFAYEIPNLEKGRHINNIISMANDDSLLTILPVEDREEKYNIVLITRNGVIKVSNLSDYSGARRKGGVIGINLRDDDVVVAADISMSLEDTVFMVNKVGKGIRFPMKDCRVLGRLSFGVIGMKSDCPIIGGNVISDSSEGYLFAVTTNGMVKVSELSHYKVQRRGGTGVKVMRLNDKTGEMFKVMYSPNLNASLYTITEKGIINKISTESLRTTSRVTSGVKLVSLDGGDALADFYVVDHDIVDHDNIGNDGLNLNECNNAQEGGCDD